MVKWIIQNNLIKPKVLQAFQDAFTALNIDFEEVKVIPFSSELPAFQPSEANLFYGSTTLMLNAHASHAYQNGVFYDPDQFNVASYMKAWPGKMLNEDGQVMPFQQFIQEMVDRKTEWFIRPNEDDKSFAGTTMTTVQIKDWYGKIAGLDMPKLNPDTLIFASEPKIILKEWRNFIVDGKVIDASRYMFKGELHISKDDCPQLMVDFVEDCAATFSPHDIFVMDIAETSNGFKIIECNCFNGTGFYNHDIHVIVAAVTESVRKRQAK